MSESETGFTEINLDDTKPIEDQAFEIVEEDGDDGAGAALPLPKPTARTETPTRDEDEDDDDGGGADDDGEGEGRPRKRLTRTQRLKAQRDAYAQQLQETLARTEEIQARLKKYETDAEEGAGVALDIYIQSIDSGIKAARADFDKAFASGDQDALWQTQIRLAELIAEKKNAEGERRKIPQRGSESGGEARPPTRQTQEKPTSPAQPTAGKPSPAALEWHKNNQWFGRDPVMTAVARTIDAAMVNDGYDISDLGYFDELDRRLQEELPHKFKTEQPRNRSPVAMNKTTPAASGGKIRVTLTADDKRMAAQMGISLERFARQKYLRQQAEAQNGYVEIV